MTQQNAPMDEPDVPHRRSLRLKGYNYAQAGAYFVTICTHERKCLPGEVNDGVMRLNAVGAIVKECWEAIAEHTRGAELDAYMIMPNHVHGIIVFTPNAEGEMRLERAEGETCLAPTPDAAPSRKRSLGTVVGAFKAAVTKEIRQRYTSVSIPLWQRNYYEHVIRSDAALARIREYITDNPLKWALDRDNPANWR